ncbi:hypothetical protein TCAL_04382 [Tigriopus californicus]|uniref:LRRCT domain-containing protein n=1 Tax=Tigriopus californicus TaxID=6832 RepID=A0A553NPQ6_TIGCA|nr:leucine-rich repeat neuronal protein 1-like [Tigriopus californicus]TRY67416.1 hypothetical protein TCAL_04382 [Tigriopus californicus]|eukprot:TCALIF_04382-PA protein Name:"Similar to LRRN1 Leucine-rich repeat neuronal protein 1 (Bos taurus)" AED:0.04 eAED:0.06 QI:0/-1/0/1/-1/1/1/0/516
MDFKLVLGLFALTSLLGPCMVHSGNICTQCDCKVDLVPYFVDCSAKDRKQVPFNVNVNGENMTAIMMDLDLSSNRIEVLNPLARDLNLHSLSLKQNNIVEIKNNAFKDQLFLSYLDLSYNQLTSDMIKREVFEGQYSKTEYKPLPLLVLDLSHNRITTISRNAFEHLFHLRELKLDGNSLRSIEPSTEHALMSLMNLMSLSLADALLDTLPENILAGFSRLIRLDLSGNRFQDVPSALRRAKHLTNLNLAGNLFSQLDQGMFITLEHLEILNVSYQKDLTSVGPKTFSSLKKLKSLFLQKNPKLDFIHPDIFEDHKAENFSLKHLHLNGNGLKYLPTGLVPSFNNWHDLETIDLEDNPWACNCHNEWMFTALIDVIKRVSPTLVANIICREPKELRGTAMEDLVLKPADIACPSHDGFNVYKEHYGMFEKRRHFVDPGTHHGHKVTMALGVVCSVVTLSFLAIAAVYFMRKRQPTLYRSLHNLSSGQSQYSMDDPQRHGDIVRSTFERNQDDITIR